MQFSVSPCSNPELGLDEVLTAYGDAGFDRIELFTSWVKSALDPAADVGPFREAIDAHDFHVSSIHLPKIGDDVDGGLAAVERIARRARALGCPIVIFKADSKRRFIDVAPRVVEVLEPFGVTPVLTNHWKTPISDLADYKEVLDGIDVEGIECLLELGHFHSAGVDWREAYEFLGDRMAICHVKDQIGPQSVPFGEGEIDLEGFFKRLDADDFAGDVVFEMEVTDQDNTLLYVKEAREYAERVLAE